MAGRCVRWGGRGVWRVWLLALVVGLGLVLAPVPQAVADDDRHVGTIAELVDAFATAPSTGTRTVTLTTSITGTAVLSDAVAVAAGATMVLDLNGKNLILAGRTAKAGLGVPAGTALTITDTAPSPGTLTATGGFHGRNIATHKHNPSGNLRRRKQRQTATDSHPARLRPQWEPCALHRPRD